MKKQSRVSAGELAKPKSKTATGKKSPRSRNSVMNLRLYVAGQTPKSIAAFANLKNACEEYLPGKYVIEVIDLIQNPKLARGDQILAIPTVVRRLPVPMRKLIGDLSNREKLLVGLEFKVAGK